MEDYLVKYKELREVVDRLLGPDGCPWDQKQTHDTLKNYLIEEAYEFVEAVEEDNYEMMEEELGDVLFHVFIHAAIAEKNNSFSMVSVADRIREKMIRRHPHVFGDAKVSSVDEVWKNWDEIKRQEKQSDKQESLLNNIPKSLPSLMRAEKIQKRAARVGFDWVNEDQVWGKLEEELLELKTALKQADKKQIQEEIGDVLFTVANLARKYHVGAEEALQHTNNKFIQRFSFIESRLAAQGRSLEDATLDEMDKLWDESKTQK